MSFGRCYKGGGTKDAREKNEFRKTHLWRQFRIEMKGRSCNRDYLTQKPLNKMWNLHHKCMKTEEYKKLSPERFCCLNSQSHDVVHFIFRYYIKDPLILERLKQLMEEMKELN